MSQSPLSESTDLQRFTRLRLENFRAFPSGIPELDVDANVVLIYGNNGVGKTSLLSAIEFAVCGEVQHLRKYKKDYPRVLRHFGSTGPAYVSAKYRNAKGEIEIHRDLSEPKSPSLSSQFRSAFSDRCYLSQSKLSRLISLYQSPSATSGDPPLIRFVRELLDLDYVDNLSRGLHVAGDIRRIRKQSRGFGDLEDRMQSVANRVEEEESAYVSSRKQVEELWSTVYSTASQLPGLFSSDRSPLSSPVSPTVADELRRIASEWIRTAGSTAERLRILSQELDEILVAFTDEAGNVSNADHQKVGVDELTRSIETRIEEVETSLRKLIAGMGSQMPALDRNKPANVRVAAIDRIIADAIEKIHAATESVSNDREEAETLASRLSEIADELGELEGQQDSTSRDLDALIEGLSLLRTVIDDDTCPVCDRDYGEMGGRLDTHVSNKIVNLTDHAERVRTRLDRTATLKAEREELDRKQRVLEDRLQANKSFLESTPDEDEFRTLTDHLEEITSFIADRDRLRGELSDSRTTPPFSEGIDRLLVRANSLLQECHSLKLDGKSALYEQDSVEESHRADDVVRVLSRVKRQVDKETSDLDSNLDLIKNVNEDLSRYREKLNEYEQRGSRLAHLELEQDKLMAAWTRANRVIDDARDLRRAAAETQEHLLQEVFDDRLNKLVDDLYGRLVRDERFRPHLSSMLSRGALSAAIHAYRHGKKAFEDIASVVSSANLNTAALSLFVALHLVEAPRLKALIFDDPVQSMDDVHVIQLSALLRTLAYEAETQRQVIVAVHDRALFDYLSLEVGPTKTGDRMVTLELAKDSSNGVVIGWNDWTWEPDKVSFGAA